jgi:hypothetical protein
MPRPSRAPRLRRPADMDHNKMTYLSRGFAFFLREPFKDEDEMRECWNTHREMMLSFRDSIDDRRPASDYASGTRPWAWWVFERNQEPPHCEYRIIEQLGVLYPGEREAAIKYARTEWERWTRGWTEEARAEAALVTDEQLLDAWPTMPMCEVDPEEEDKVWIHNPCGTFKVRRKRA